jgi:hypothetical protein
MNRRRLPSPAAVIALVALFVALSGGAAAGTFVADRAVTSHATDNAQALRVAKLTRKAALWHSAVRAGTVIRRGPRGPRGFRGPRGPRGPQGPQGGFTTSNITYVSGPVSHLCQLGGGDCAVGASAASCPTGKVAIGGGWIGDTPDPPISATAAADGPMSDGAGWAVILVNDTSSTTASFHAVAACAG